MLMLKGRQINNCSFCPSAICAVSVSPHLLRKFIQLILSLLITCYGRVLSGYCCLWLSSFFLSKRKVKSCLRLCTCVCGKGRALFQTSVTAKGAWSGSHALPGRSSSTRDRSAARKTAPKRKAPQAEPWHRSLRLPEFPLYLQGKTRAGNNSVPGLTLWSRGGVGRDGAASSAGSPFPNSV